MSPNHIEASKEYMRAALISSHLCDSMAMLVSGGPRSFLLVREELHSAFALSRLADLRRAVIYDQPVTTLPVSARQCE